MKKDVWGIVKEISAIVLIGLLFGMGIWGVEVLCSRQMAKYEQFYMDKPHEHRFLIMHYRMEGASEIDVIVDHNNQCEYLYHNGGLALIPNSCNEIKQ